MPRLSRRIEPGLVYHVSNRAIGRRMLFRNEADFAAFDELLAETVARANVDLLAYCLLDNHWHLLVRPRTAGALSRFMGLLTLKHARRQQGRYPKSPRGRVYQARFKSFPVQPNEHFLAVVRYIHAHPVRMKQVERAQDWRWSDIVRRRGGPKLTAWPMPRPRNWVALVNRPMEQPMLDEVEVSLKRGRPLGDRDWVKRIAKRLGLESKLRPQGRPPSPAATLSSRQRRRRQRTPQVQKAG